MKVTFRAMAIALLFQGFAGIGGAATQEEEIRAAFQAPEDHGETLKRVQAALEPILARLPVGAVSQKQEGDNLEILYLPQTFQVHSIGMDGAISEKATDQIGPSYKGMVLRINRQKLNAPNQVGDMTEHREPYWSFDLVTTPLTKEGSQLCWVLCYGVRTDPKLLAAVRQALQSLRD